MSSANDETTANLKKQIISTQENLGKISKREKDCKYVKFAYELTQPAWREIYSRWMNFVKTATMDSIMPKDSEEFLSNAMSASLFDNMSIVPGEEWGSERCQKIVDELEEIYQKHVAEQEKREKKEKQEKDDANKSDSATATQSVEKSASSTSFVPPAPFAAPHPPLDSPPDSFAAAPAP